MNVTNTFYTTRSHAGIRHHPRTTRGGDTTREVVMRAQTSIHGRRHRRHRHAPEHRQDGKSVRHHESPRYPKPRRTIRIGCGAAKKGTTWLAGLRRTSLRFASPHGRSPRMKEMTQKCIEERRRRKAPPFTLPLIHSIPSSHSHLRYWPLDERFS